MGERECRKSFAGLDALRLMPQYQTFAVGMASPHVLGTIPRERQVFDWCAVGRPGADLDRMQADLDRLERERLILAGGILPPWADADGGRTFATAGVQSASPS